VDSSFIYTPQLLLHLLQRCIDLSPYLHNMAEQQKRAPGGHYSGANPIPTIQKFVESLDRDKKDRDKRIKEEHSRKLQQTQADATPHKASDAAKSGTRQTVTDPTTGHEVVIEDVNKDFMKASQDPKVGVGNSSSADMR